MICNRSTRSNSRRRCSRNSPFFCPNFLGKGEKLAPVRVQRERPGLPLVGLAPEPPNPELPRNSLRPPALPKDDGMLGRLMFGAGMVGLKLLRELPKPGVIIGRADIGLADRIVVTVGLAARLENALALGSVRAGLERKLGAELRLGAARIDCSCVARLVHTLVGLGLDACGIEAVIGPPGRRISVRPKFPLPLAGGRGLMPPGAGGRRLPRGGWPMWQ